MAPHWGHFRDITSTLSPGMIPLSLDHSCNTGLLGQRDSTSESRVILGLGTSYLEINSDFLPVGR